MSLVSRAVGRDSGRDVMQARWLAGLALATGAVCLAIGLLHIALGIASEPGLGGFGATVDSRERFYGAVFAGYGLAWIWAVRTAPRPARAVRALALVLLAGGLSRLLSVAVHGQPHWFQLVLTAVELVLPLVFLVPQPRARNGPSAPW